MSTKGHDMQAAAVDERLEKLSAKEQTRRKQLEAYIIENMQTFVQVGMRLAEIAQARLYRSTHVDFPSYCKDILEMSAPRAYQLMDAAYVVEQISTIGRDSVELPKNERQVRPLLPYKDDPAKVANLWREAVDTAPDGKVTAKHVQATVFDMTGEQVTKTIKRQRNDIRKDDKISKDFAIAFDAFLAAVEKAKETKYQTTTREAILKRLDILRKTLAEDGTRHIKDRMAG